MDLVSRGSLDKNPAITLIAGLPSNHTRRGVEVTLSQIAQIKNLVDGDESDGTKRQRIQVILDKVQG